MGAGIAQLAAQQGFEVILFDVNQDSLQRAETQLEQALQQLSAKGVLPAETATAARQRLLFTTSIADCRAELLIEAIVEEPGAKSRLFAQLAAINGPGALYTTNTSSLSVTALSQDFPYPENFAGLHFFNPAVRMKLVEVIATPLTSDATLEALTLVAGQLDKVPVVCKDAPGFLVNRVARHYYLEAMRLVEAGHTTVEQADRLLEAAGFRMGPFRLTDLIGQDINYSVSNIVYNALGQPARLRPSPLQQQLVATGRLGRKTGSGFYNY